MPQIQQRLVGDLQRAEFDELINLLKDGPNPTPYWFDEQGNYTDEDATQAGAEGRLYDAKVILIHPAVVAGVKNYNLAAQPLPAFT